MRKQFNADDIRALGIELIRSFTNAGNTVVTNKEGAEVISELDREAMAKQMAEDMLLKISKLKTKKPKSKYPSNYTPPKNKNRKTKSKY